ncbi:MAG: hypothetical protein V3W06_09165 [Acidimicrobiia bacterium]
MALLVICAQPSRLPGNPRNYDEGDVVSVMEDGQRPGGKEALSPKLAFVKVPGTAAEWEHLKEAYHLQALDPDGFMDNVELLARRKQTLTVLEDPATKAEALDWATTPTMTKAVVDAATVDKSKPAAL